MSQPLSTKSKIRKGAFWIFWLLLLTAPMLWVTLVFDKTTRQYLAKFNLERFYWWIQDLPRNLVSSWSFWAFVAVGIAFWIFQKIPGKEQKIDGFKSLVSQKYESIPSRTRFIASFFILPILIICTCAALNDQQRSWGIFIGIYIILAMGLNLTVGMTGLLVLGYAAFYGIGAYTYAILNQWYAVPVWLAFIPAAGVGALVGLLIGLPSIRLRGDYLAIVTLGFGEVLRILLKNLKSFSGGDEGLFIDRKVRFPKLESLPLFPDGITREASGFCVMGLLVILSIWAIYNLVHSRIGRAWIAIREDETAASAMGIPTFRLKLLAFSLSAAWAAVAGVCFAAAQGHVVPDSFGFVESIFILSMVILGGMGTVYGPVFGAAVFYLGYEMVRSKLPDLTDYRLMIFGAVMVILMVVRPQGLLGSRRRKIELGLEEE
jgi:branched-chain amino acid transport system permease protein